MLTSDWLQGPGLVFEVYPQAVATLPGSQFWSVIFFFMLIMLGMDSAMGGLECVITGLMDEYQDTFRRRGISREMFTGLVVFSSYIVAITCVTPVGVIYIIYNIYNISPISTNPQFLQYLHHVSTGRDLHLQPPGELRGGSVAADHGVSGGRGCVLGLRPQELQRRRVRDARPPARPLLEDHLEVHQSLLPGCKTLNGNCRYLHKTMS